MRASVGDTLHVHHNHIGIADTYARIVEIRGTNGTPPYTVQFPDGHTTLIFPGPDCVVEPTEPDSLLGLSEAARQA